MKNKLVIIFALLHFTLLNAQENNEKTTGRIQGFLQIESGLFSPAGEVRKNIAIRQSVSNYTSDNSGMGFIDSQTNHVIAGLRWEFYHTDFRAGISAGLRYNMYSSEIKGYAAAGTDFFYLRYSMEGSDTRFARVKSVTEEYNFISIPVELKYVPFQFRSIGFFVKAGIEFSSLDKSKALDISFREDTMDLYRKTILNSVISPSTNFYSTLYGSLGIKYGRTGRTNYTVEFYMPSMYLTKNNFILTNNTYFQGFRISAEIPVF